MVGSRPHSRALSLALVALVFALDGLWSLLVGSTGSLAYGLIDWPAHLATCVLCLLAYTAWRGEPPSASFVTAALVGSVAIDLDHVPGYLGSHLVTGSLPRPYTHSLLLVLVLLAVAAALRRSEQRQLWLGLAFGVSTHLFRDLATGPGISFLWPLDDGAARLPYAAYAAALVLTFAAVCLASSPSRRADRKGTMLPAAASRVATSALVPVLLAAAALTLFGTGSAAARVAFGAYIPGADNNPGKIGHYSRLLGRKPAVVVVYKDWGNPPFEAQQLDGIWRNGAVPLVTWEPWVDGQGVSLRAIAAGHFDRYLRQSARSVAAWKRPLMVRFAQEMNAPWFPWSGRPAAFRAAWKHIVRVFRRQGAVKVRWVWTPYAESAGSSSFRRYYPGGSWVDWVGMDGINWGGSYPWRSFRQIFGASYHRLLRLAPRKPMMIAETGSGDRGGNKARWLSRMLDRNLPRMTHVRAVLFWSVEDERGDIRVNSSPAALGAMRSALREPFYAPSRRALNRIGAPARSASAPPG